MVSRAGGCSELIGSSHQSEVEPLVGRGLLEWLQFIASIGGCNGGGLLRTELGQYLPVPLGQ